MLVSFATIRKRRRSMSANPTPVAAVATEREGADPVLELERFLPYRLSVLSNRISQDIARLYAQRFALGTTEWRVLAVLGRYPELSASELVERTAMDKVAISRAVARLLQDGRILRRLHAGDRRRWLLSLSAKGQRIYHEVAPLALRLEAELLTGLSADEQALLHRILDRLDAAELNQAG